MSNIIRKYFLNRYKPIFYCPFCKKSHEDNNDKLLNRINKNKNSITKVECDCKNNFFITQNHKGELISFVQRKPNNKK